VKSNQGLATGIAVSGSTGGQFIILPALALLIGAYDWRLSFVVLGVGSILAMFMIQVWFPSDRNREQRDEDVTSNHASVWSDLRKIAKLPAFQILFWSYFICGYTTTGVIETHFIPYSLICGFSPVLSASAYGVLSAVNLAGMILAGWLTDRMSRPLLLFLIYLVRGVTFVILLNVGASFETLILFAVLFGLADYSTVPATASLVATHIGRHVMGLAFGIISAGHQVGAAAGAYLGGVLFDLYADYGWVWWSSVWLAVFAGMLVIFLKDKPSDTARADQFVAGVS
jgi:predicted MFS family arabinose efflux permease